MDIYLEPLPGAEAKPLSRLAATAPLALRPDFMPVEQHAAKAFVWQWLREELTYHTCYEREQELIDAVADFQNQINTQPLTLSDRLWVKKHLEPEEEKLRVSK